MPILNVQQSPPGTMPSVSSANMSSTGESVASLRLSSCANSERDRLRSSHLFGYCSVVNTMPRGSNPLDRSASSLGVISSIASPSTNSRPSPLSSITTMAWCHM